jgi:guanylate kinase
MKNLLIIDGPSAVGKSTMVNLLIEQNQLPFYIVKRYTTRVKRNTAEDANSYEFVNSEEFQKMIDAGSLLEHYHYLFGMSYGLPKKEVIEAMQAGKNVIGMINLGNLRMVKQEIPNCFGVFLNASLDTIRKRLEDRGTHTAEQIEERLGNAKRGQSFVGDYDLEINTDAISPQAVLDKIIKAYKKHCAA